MSASFRESNGEALVLSQQTAEHLRKYSSVGNSRIPIPFWSPTEPIDLWATYEKHLLSCLRTGNDKAAHLCLERLIGRFGATNERVMGLHGLYQEAVAKDDLALEKVLDGYDELLAENPVNMPIAKRRIALLQSLSRPSDAIDALVELLEGSPTDIEAWAELSELYFAQALYAQAIFCLEEVLVSAPNAWNVHARLGEILLVSSSSNTEAPDVESLAEALRRFCRSIELCDNYLRGYYGLKVAAERYLNKNGGDQSRKQAVLSNAGEIPLPSLESVHRLNELATSKLAEVTRKGGSAGQDEAEIIAARGLLDRSASQVSR